MIPSGLFSVHANNFPHTSVCTFHTPDYRVLRVHSPTFDNTRVQRISRLWRATIGSRCECLCRRVHVTASFMRTRADNTRYIIHAMRATRRSNAERTSREPAETACESRERIVMLYVSSWCVLYVYAVLTQFKLRARVARVTTSYVHMYIVRISNSISMRTHNGTCRARRSAV